MPRLRSPMKKQQPPKGHPPKQQPPPPPPSDSPSAGEPQPDDEFLRITADIPDAVESAPAPAAQQAPEPDVIAPELIASALAPTFLDPCLLRGPRLTLPRPPQPSRHPNRTLSLLSS